MRSLGRQRSIDGGIRMSTPLWVLPITILSRIGRLLFPEGLARGRFFYRKTVGKTGRRYHDAYQIPNIMMYELCPSSVGRLPGSAGDKLSHCKGAIISTPCRHLSEEIVKGIGGSGPGRSTVSPGSPGCARNKLRDSQACRHPITCQNECWRWQAAGV